MAANPRPNGQHGDKTGNVSPRRGPHRSSPGLAATLTCVALLVLGGLPSLGVMALASGPGATGVVSQDATLATGAQEPPPATLEPTATATPEPTATATATAIPRATSTTVPTATATVTPTLTSTSHPTATETTIPTPTVQVTATTVPTAASRRVARVAEATATAQAQAAATEEPLVSVQAIETTTVTYTITGLGTHPTTQPLLPSQTLALDVTAVTGQTRVDWRVHNGGSCAGTPRSSTSTAVIPAGSATYSVQAQTFNATERIGDSGCLPLVVRVGMAVIVYEDPPAFLGNDQSDTFSVRILRTSDEIGPQPAGTVQLHLCRTTTTPNPADCTVGAPAAPATSVTATVDGAPKTGSIRYQRESHVFTRFVSDSTGRQTAPITTVTSDGVATATLTITYTPAGFAAQTWTTPLLPAQTLAFTSTPVTRQTRVEWRLHDGALCSGPSLIATTVTGVSSLVAGTYSGRVLAFNSRNGIVGDSGCRVMTVRAGAAQIAFTDRLAYRGNEVSDSFSPTVPRATGESVVGPPPAGRVDITLCPVASYTAAQCQTATGLPVVTTVNVANGSAATGSVAMP